MLVFAHPDDETVSATTLLPEMKDSVLVYVTDGAPKRSSDAEAAGCATREAYAELRRSELIAALDTAGVPLERVILLGCVDQETPRELVTLTIRLELLIREHAPRIVLTHPYEGGHPDHDSTAFAVHTAVRRLARDGAPTPIVAEFASYHAADAVVARAFTDRLFGRFARRSEEAQWEYGEFLKVPGRVVLTAPLSPEQRELKKQLMVCHRSQHAVLGHVPLDAERFRLAPRYDFTEPPHRGRLLYEHFTWGVTGDEWRAAARVAMSELRSDHGSSAGREAAVR